MDSVACEYVITLVSARGIAAELIEKIKCELAATRVVWLSENEAVDIYCPSSPKLENRIHQVVAGAPVDVFVQQPSMRRKKLLIADMESTIIKQEMLDELADMIGLRDTVAQITHRAMNGEIDFARALRERVALLKGKPASLLSDVAARIDLMSGAATLIATMRANGAKCWLASGGFDYFAKVVVERLEFDSFFSNKIELRDGLLTGEVSEPIFDSIGKKRLLDKAFAELGLTVGEIAAVGDGSNDIAMLTACGEGQGLGVAFHAKPSVRDVIRPQINHNDLTALLFAQGYPREAFIAV